MLEDAIQRGAIAEVEIHWKHGTLNINTALEKCWEWNKSNSIQVAEVLPKCKADPNYKNQYQATPLYFAAINISIGLASILLAADSDVNCADIIGHTPLHYAVRNHPFFNGEDSSREMISFLLNNGSLVNTLTKRDESPLLILLDRRMASFETINPVPALMELILSGADLSRSINVVLDSTRFQLANDRVKESTVECLNLLLIYGAWKMDYGWYETLQRNR